MRAELEIWKNKRKFTLAQRMGKDEAAAKAEAQYENMKEAVSLSLEEMDAYWEKKGFEKGTR